jgi:hypothetical protein
LWLKTERNTNLNKPFITTITLHLSNTRRFESATRPGSLRKAIHKIEQEMMTNASLLFLACLLTLLSSPATTQAQESLYNDIYHTIIHDAYCVRLLTVHGETGCSTPSSASEYGTQGTVRLCETQACLDSLVATPPAYDVALLIPQTLFTGVNVAAWQAEAALRLAGVVLLRTACKSCVGAADAATFAGPPQPFPLGYSPAPLNPDAGVDMHARVLNATGFEWNPLGSGLSHRKLDFAVVLVPTKDEKRAMSLASLNEDAEQMGHFASHVVEFDYRMDTGGLPAAQRTSTGCLNTGRCKS